MLKKKEKGCLFRMREEQWLKLLNCVLGDEPNRKNLNDFIKVLKRCNILQKDCTREHT